MGWKKLLHKLLFPGAPVVLLSVPVASVLYALLRRDVHKRLACKE